MPVRRHPDTSYVERMSRREMLTSGTSIIGHSSHAWSRQYFRIRGVEPREPWWTGAWHVVGS
jgi:hypothetical protein